MSNTIISNGKYLAFVDEHHRVIIKDKKGGGTTDSQSVEALLLLEILNCLKELKNES